MGTYTKVIVKLTLRDNVPDEVRTFVKLLVEDGWDEASEHIDKHFANSHPYFSNDRCHAIFGNFTGDTECHRMWTDPGSIDCISSVKNYGNLVSKFCDWVTPFVDLDLPFLITSTCEDSDYDGNLHTYIHALENISFEQLNEHLDGSKAHFEDTVFDHASVEADYKKRYQKPDDYDRGWMFGYIPKTSAQSRLSTPKMVARAKSKKLNRIEKIRKASRRRNRKQ